MKSVLKRVLLFWAVSLVLLGTVPAENQEFSFTYKFFSIKYDSKVYANLSDEFSKTKLLSESAKELMSYMDESVSPCDNFYKYACGNFERIHPIPPQKSSYTVSDLLRDRLKTISQRFVAEPPSPADSAAATKVKLFYQACIDIERRKKRGIKPALDYIKSLGGWTVLGQTRNEESFDWVRVAGKVAVHRIDTLITIRVGVDNKYPDSIIISLSEDPTAIPLPRLEVLNNSTRLEIVRKFTEDVLLFSGVSPDLALETSRDILSFQIELAKLTVDANTVENFKDHYERTSILKLRKRVPGIDWYRLLRSAFGRRIHPNQAVNIVSTRYIYSLSKLLKRKSKRSIANYIFWKILFQSTTALDERYDKIRSDFAKAIFGMEKLPSLKERCSEFATTILSKPIEAMFLRTHFKRETREEVTKMAEKFGDTLRKMIKQKDWLDDQTKREVLRKLDSMLIQMAYPDFLLDDDIVNNLFAGFKIIPSKYYESLLNIISHMMQSSFNALGEKILREQWPINTMTVNAFYFHNANKILIPAGKLQPPYYHVDFPKAVNFGAIGMILGHELTHAFDKRGREYDKNGRLQNDWSNSSSKAFDELTECFVEQYNGYSLRNVSIRGRATLDENIADVGGLRLAYYSYLDWLKNRPSNESLLLPGLRLTDKQLFFLSSAHIWCTAVRPEALVMGVKSGVHSPNEIRVRGSLSNMEEFSEAFNCPVGSPMNPKRKCIIW